MANHIQYKNIYYARYARDLTMAADGHAYGMARAAPGIREGVDFMIESLCLLIVLLINFVI